VIGTVRNDCNSKVLVHEFEANKLLANMRFDENNWELKQASLSHGSGALLVKVEA